MKNIAKMLEGKGGTLAVPSEGFSADTDKGPLSANELERAGAWAQKVVRWHVEEHGCN